MEQPQCNSCVAITPASLPTRPGCALPRGLMGRPSGVPQRQKPRFQLIQVLFQSAEQ
jgi:hypothetical protein